MIVYLLAAAISILVLIRFISFSAQRQPPMVKVPWYAPSVMLYTTYQIISGNSKYLDKTIKEVGQFFRVKSILGMKYMATGPEMYRQIWKGRIFEGMLPVVWFDILGRNAISGLKGAKHARMRKLFSSAFTVESLNEYLPLSQNCTKKFLEDLSTIEGEVDVYPLVKQYTLDIICNFTFSTDSTQDKRLVSLNQDLTELVKGFGSLVRWNVPGTRYYKSLQVRQKVVTLFTQLLKERRQSANVEEFNDILSKLMRAQDENGDQMNDEEIVDSLITIVFAGHDTSTASICSSLVILDRLADKSDVQKLKQEVLEHYPLSRDLSQDYTTYSELNSLAFLEAWVKETLRLKGPIPGLMRIATQDTTLQCPMANGIQEYDVKAGETMTVDYQRVMLSSDYYKDPSKFIPTRLYQDQPYVPFGGGLRVCLGRDLAKMEIKLFLINLLRSYQVEVTEVEEIRFPMFYSKPKVLVKKV